MVERFSRNITDKRIRRDSFTSAQALELAIDLYVALHKIDPKAFVWTASAKEILVRATRGKSGSGSGRGISTEQSRTLN